MCNLSLRLRLPLTLATQQALDRALGDSTRHTGMVPCASATLAERNRRHAFRLDTPAPHRNETLKHVSKRLSTPLRLSAPLPSRTRPHLHRSQHQYQHRHQHRHHRQHLFSLCGTHASLSKSYVTWPCRYPSVFFFYHEERAGPMPLRVLEPISLRLKPREPDVVCKNL